MKISEFTSNQHVDEISAAGVGQAAGKATRAVGTGIKNFAQGFAQGFKGKPNASTGSTEKGPLDDIKTAIGKLPPKQLAALRKQIAQKAGVQ